MGHKPNILFVMADHLIPFGDEAEQRGLDIQNKERLE
jgi:hypothetical protein